MQAGLSVAKLNRYNNLPVEGKSRDARAIQSAARKSTGTAAERTRMQRLCDSTSVDQLHARRDRTAQALLRSRQCCAAASRWRSATTAERQLETRPQVFAQLRRSPALQGV